jgi:uncharacterized repeat protein (TIGR01451 family)
MNYWLILVGCLLLTVFRRWQIYHPNYNLSILRHLITLFSIAILTTIFSYFTIPVMGFTLAIISQVMIILLLQRKGSANSKIQKWVNHRHQSNSTWLVISIASLVGAIGIWLVPGVSELFKLILTTIFLCLSFSAMTRWIRLRAWVMAGIISSTLLGSIHLEGLFSAPALAASETFAAGAYIIDMGQATQTIANGLKPYGLVYELVVKNAIPVKWAIDPNKVRDGADFIANGKTYKGGSFIIAPEYATQAAAIVTAWKGQGVVVDGPLASGFTTPIYDTITNFPNAVLDFGNGSIAQSYYTNAGIPASTTGTYGSFNTYRFGYPSSLTSCDDLFVMPHADPTWANHNNLIPFVQSKGFLWAACHAVSVLERVDDPADADTLPDMNFLSHVPPAIQDSKSLKLFGSHAAPTAGPYQYSATSGTSLPYSSGTNLAAFPIMQFIGKIDTATQNGSEQVYIPDLGAQWRNETAIAVYDQANTDPMVLNTAPTSQAKAAKMAFGAAFGNSSNGMVMYEAGHSHAKETTPDNIAAQRAFLNFNLLNGLVRGIKVDVNIPSAIAPGATVNLATSNGGSPAVQVSGGSGPYSYQWYSNCGGTFSNPTAQNPTFTAPISGGTCTLRVIVKDACNRRSFGADTALIPATTDVSITKNDNVTQVYDGQTVPYTITVTNKGTTTIAGVQISDRAFNGNPNGTVWTSATPSMGTGNALNLTGSNDPFYGQLEKNTYTSDELLVSNLSIGSFKNSSGTVVTKIDLKNATDTPSINLYNWTGLNLAPGQSATLTLTGTVNKGTSEIYIANLITVEPINSSGTVLIDSDPNNNRYYDADKLFAVSKKPDLKVTKTHTSTNPNLKPGDPITYTVTVQNISTGDDAAADVVFTDLVPASINVTGWNCAVSNGGKDATKTSCGATTSGTGNSISYGATPLLTGMKLSKSDTNITTLTFTINGTISTNIGTGIITNTATVAPRSADGDPNLGNNTAIDSLTIPTADLEITKSDNQATAIAGTDTSYQITVKNNGPNTVTAFTIQDLIPNELILKTPAISNVSSGTFNYNITTNQGLWNGLNLKVGESITFSLDTTLKADAVGTLQSGKYLFTNTAQILTTGIQGLNSNNIAVLLIETNSTNNSSSDTDEILHQADLAITKSDGVSFGKQNDLLTYTLRVTNNGPSTVNNLTILDRVTKNSLTNTIFGTPSIGTLTPVNPAFSYNSTTDKDEATLNWSGVNLTPGQSATVTITAKVSLINGNLSNIAIVSLPPGFTDPNLGNNQSEDIDAISTAPPTVDLVIKKDNGQTIATPGQTITYQITVINKSSVGVNSIKVSDVIPPDLINTQLFATSGDYDPITGLWTNIYLAPNGDENNPANTPDSTVKLILEGTVQSPPSQAKLTNTATVEAPADLKPLETNLGNNIAIDEDSYPVVGNPNVLLVKRITAINGNRTRNPNDNTLLNGYQDQTGARAADDNHPNWPTPINSNSSLGGNISTFLQGAIDGGKVRAGDAIEYTIYFLNAGGANASNLKICDRITPNQLFKSNTYALDKGIQLQIGNNGVLDLTNTADSIDRGQFIIPNGSVTGCNLQGPNDDGTIAINVTGTSGNPILNTLSGSAGSATPNSYGLIRFTTKVKS